MNNYEKKALLNAVGRVKVAAYLVKLAKLGQLCQHRCRNCGSTSLDAAGNCRRCRGAFTKKAILNLYR